MFSLFSKLFTKTERQNSDDSHIDGYIALNNLTKIPSSPIFHHDKSIESKLLIVDPYYSLYIIEKLDWHLDEIKDAKPMLSKFTSKSHADINVDEIQKFILQKFNEVLHSDYINVSKVLYLPNITHDEYIRLNSSFQELIPSNALLLKDSSNDDIKNILHKNREELLEPIDTARLVSALFVQKCILEEERVAITDTYQDNYITSKLAKENTLCGAYSSGKTSVIILKVLLLKLENPDTKITIITSSTYAADMIRAKMLALIEYAIVDVALETIQVIAINTLRESIKGSGYLFCDDVQLYTKAQLEKIYKASKKFTLTLSALTCNDDVQNFHLENQYHIQSEINYENFLSADESDAMSFKTGNIFMYTLLAIENILKEDSSTHVMILVDNVAIIKPLVIEINEYYDNICSHFDATLHANQLTRSQVEIVMIHEASMLRRDHVLLILQNSVDPIYIQFALSRAKKHIEIIREDNDEKNNQE